MKGAEQLQLQPGGLVLLPFLPTFLFLPAPSVVQWGLQQHTLTSARTWKLLAPLAESCGVPPLPSCPYNSHSSADPFLTSFPREKGLSCPTAPVPRPSDLSSTGLRGAGSRALPGSLSLQLAAPSPANHLGLTAGARELPLDFVPFAPPSLCGGCKTGSWGILAARLPSAPREVPDAEKRIL